MKKYEFSLTGLIKEIEKYFSQKNIDRVRIIEGSMRDNICFGAQLIERQIPYYFSNGESKKRKRDYEVNLKEIKIIY